MKLEGGFLLEKQLALRERPMDRIPVMRQRWSDLLFLHWRWSAEEVQKTLPPGLFVDTYKEAAYLAITPFFMSGVHPTLLPPVPFLSRFLELNVRTYVYDREGRPGVWFYSLDCSQPIASVLGRTFFNLPYRTAQMSASKTETGTIIYQSEREETKSQFTYSGKNTIFRAVPGTLEFFLVERYLLYAWDETARRLFSGRVWHAPYELADVDLLQHDQGMLELNGFKGRVHPPDHRIYAPGVDVEVFALETV